MASRALTRSLHQFLKAFPPVGSSPASLRALITGTPTSSGPIEGADAHMKDGTPPVMGESAASDTRGMASAAAVQTHEEADEDDKIASRMVEKAKDMGEKAKESVQEACDSAKETTRKMNEMTYEEKVKVMEMKENIEEKLQNSVRPEDYPRQQ